MGLSQELALCTSLHERAISQLRVASEKSLLCLFQFHTRCWSFVFFFSCCCCCFGLGVLCPPTIVQKVSVSQAEQLNVGKLLQICPLKQHLSEACCFADLRVKKQFAEDQTRSHITGSCLVLLHYIHYPPPVLLELICDTTLS